MLVVLNPFNGEVTTFEDIEEVINILVAEMDNVPVKVSEFYRAYNFSKLLQYDINYFLFRILSLPNIVAATSNRIWSGYTRTVDICQKGFEVDKYVHIIKTIFPPDSNFYSITSIESFKEEKDGTYRMRLFYDSYPLAYSENKALLGKIVRCRTIDEFIKSN